MTYQEALERRAIPTTVEGRQQECAWIRQEAARQRSMGAYVASTATMPAMILASRAAVDSNLASLDSHAARVECSAAFRTDTPAKPAIFACIEACRANTSRTADQCFDACNK